MWVKGLENNADTNADVDKCA